MPAILVASNMWRHVVVSSACQCWIEFRYSVLVWSLCQKLCPNSLPVQPDERLGDGADGEVLSIVGDPNRVIKLGVIYDNPVRPLTTYASIQQVLDYLVETQPCVYARVYQHGYLGQFQRPVVDQRRKYQPFLLYYYVMERLSKLSEDEKKVFHSILDHEDRGVAKEYPMHKIEEMLRGMSRGLDFDFDRVMMLCGDLRRLPILHLDIAARNIMKNAAGDYKLVDMDRALMENTCPRLK